MLEKLQNLFERVCTGCKSRYQISFSVSTGQLTAIMSALVAVIGLWYSYKQYEETKRKEVIERNTASPILAFLKRKGKAEHGYVEGEVVDALVNNGGRIIVKKLEHDSFFEYTLKISGVERNIVVRIPDYLKNLIKTNDVTGELVVFQVAVKEERIRDAFYEIQSKINNLKDETVSVYGIYRAGLMLKIDYEIPDYKEEKTEYIMLSARGESKSITKEEYKLIKRLLYIGEASIRLNDDVEIYSVDFIDQINLFLSNTQNK